LGGRFGWRLPTIDEVTSLLDPAVVAPTPSLPPASPFTLGGGGTTFWSVTADAADAVFHYEVHFTGDPGQPGYVANGSDSNMFRAWCVRGEAGP
jgi:hypothetical protein